MPTATAHHLPQSVARAAVLDAAIQPRLVAQGPRVTPPSPLQNEGGMDVACHAQQDLANRSKLRATWQGRSVRPFPPSRSNINYKSCRVKQGNHVHARTPPVTNKHANTRTYVAYCMQRSKKARYYN